MTRLSDEDWSRRSFARMEADLEDERARCLARDRADPAVRALHVRVGLLRWVYEQRQTGIRVSFSDSAHGWLDTGRYQVESDRFSDAEVRKAADYLRDHGLLGAVSRSSPGRRGLRITEAGCECIEHYGGEVAVYLKDRKRRGTSISIGSINSTGPVGVGDSVTQNVGVEPAAMAGFVQALLGALPSLQLEPIQEARAQAALEEVGREIQGGNPDADRVRGALSRFVQGLIDAGPQALVQLMLMFARGFVGPGA